MDNNSDLLRFFHSAGMNPSRKGTDIFIKSLTSLANITTNFKAIVHTQRAIADFFPELTNEIDQLQRTGLLEVIEKSIPAPGLYHMGDVYVYPSRLDGIGLTVAEALSCGLPVIVTDEPPMNEFSAPISSLLVAVEKRYSRSDGYYWPIAEASVSSLCSRMLEIIIGEYDINEMKLSARAYALDQLDWEKNSSVLTKLVTECQYRPPNPATERKIEIADNRKVPLFRKLRHFYYPAFWLANRYKSKLGFA